MARKRTKGNFIIKQGELYYMLTDWTNQEVTWTPDQNHAHVFTYKEHAKYVGENMTKAEFEIIEL